jgi:hypothetical protein
VRWLVVRVRLDRVGLLAAGMRPSTGPRQCVAHFEGGVGLFAAGIRPQTGPSSRWTVHSGLDQGSGSTSPSYVQGRNNPDLPAPALADARRRSEPQSPLTLLGADRPPRKAQRRRALRATNVSATSTAPQAQRGRALGATNASAASNDATSSTARRALRPQTSTPPASANPPRPRRVQCRDVQAVQESHRHRVTFPVDYHRTSRPIRMRRAAAVQ